MSTGKERSPANRRRTAGGDAGPNSLKILKCWRSAGACSACQCRNGRAMALLLLIRQTMRSVLGLVVIIAGLVSFLHNDSGTVSASPTRVAYEDVIDARDSRKDVYGNE